MSWVFPKKVIPKNTHWNVFGSVTAALADVASELLSTYFYEEEHFFFPVFILVSVTIH